MKTPKYNVIDFKEAKEYLSTVSIFYKRKLNKSSIIIKSIDCAIAALDFCINNCVLIEVEEHHTFAKPDDVSDLDFPGVSSEDK